MKLFFVSIFFLINTAANAQVKISGKITNGHNKDLAGISISIKNSYDGDVYKRQGFNQSAILCEGINDIINLPIITKM